VSAARPIILGVCSACAGQGQVPAESFETDGAMLKCLSCDGIGDLDSFRLKAAYDAGVAEGIRHMRQVLELADASTRALEARPEPSIAWLKRHVSVQPQPGDEQVAV
jgi:hypothetical protein